MKRWLFQTGWVNENHPLVPGNINDHFMINDHISLEIQFQVGNHFQDALGGNGGNVAEGFSTRTTFATDLVGILNFSS